MSNGLETPAETSVVKLVSGIITDVQDLVKQQLTLSRYELTGEVENARDAASFLGAGLAVAIIGGGLLGGMLVHLVAWIAPDIPLWGCYGIVGAPIALLGGILFAIGIQRSNRLHTPVVAFAHGLKEKLHG